jgi:HlyD family secretion protein
VLSRAVDVGQTVQAAFSAPTLFTIAEDLSRMQIDTSVAESDVGRLVAGMKVEFAVDAFPGRTFAAAVRQVRNSATTTSGVVTYDAVIDVDNPDYVLRPGMTANVTFVLDEISDALKVPNGALRFKLSGPEAMELFRQTGAPPGGGAGPPAGFGGAPPGGPPFPGGGPPPGGLGGLPPAGLGNKPSDRKVIWKLVEGKPRPVPVKAGLTDGSITQILDGDIAPGDALVIEISGLPAAQQMPKLGAF